MTSFACLITYLKARRKSESVENRLVIALILGAAALSSFALKSGLEGTIQLLVASGLMGAMAYGYRKEAEVRDMLVGTALTVASLLAPVGLHTQAASLLYSGLAMLAAIIGGKWKFRSAFALSALYLCASVLMLVSSVADQPGLTRSMEVTMLVALLSASISIATAVRSDEESPYSLLAFLVAWASVTRLGSILIALPSDFNLANASITVAWVVYGTAILTWGFISSLRYHRYAGLTVLLLTVSKVLLIDMATATPELRVGVLLLVGLAMMFGGYAYIRRRHRQVKT